MNLPHPYVCSVFTQLSEKNKYYHIAPLLEGLGKLPLLMRESTHSAVFNFAVWFPHSTFQHSPYSLTVLQPIPKSEWCHSSLHIWWYFITPHLCYCLPLSNFPFFQSFWVLSFSTLHFKWCPFRKDSLIFLGVVCVLLQNIVHHYQSIYQTHMKFSVSPNRSSESRHHISCIFFFQGYQSIWPKSCLMNFVEEWKY